MEAAVSGKKRHRRRYRNGVDSPVGTQEEPQPTAAWYWYALVIAVALVLFALFIAMQFNAMDRAVMVAVSFVCIGIAFLIIGACTAVGNFDFTDHPLPGEFLNTLAELATPRLRWGEMFYSSKALYHVFEKLLIVIVLPLGTILAFVRPKQTWPAVLWVSGGLLAIVGVYVGSVIYREMTF